MIQVQLARRDADAAVAHDDVDPHPVVRAHTSTAAPGSEYFTPFSTRFATPTRAGGDHRWR